MAAPAEKHHSRSESSVLDHAILHWLAAQGEQFTQAIQHLQHLPEKIAYQFSENKPRIPQFNVLRLQKRWEELLTQSPSPEVARQRLLALAQEDFRTYIEEYVLRKNISRFILKISSSNGHHIITDEYSTPLLTMAKEAVQDFLKQGKPASRMEADSIAIAEMMDWAMQGQDGDVAINVSPAGGSYLGNHMYSFIFIRTLHVLPNGDREIHTTQHKVWLSHMNLLRLFVQSGIQVPQHTLATELSLTKLFLPVLNHFSEAEMLKIAQSLPQQHIPPEYEEVQLQHPDQFQQEYTAVEQFILQKVDATFKQLPHTPRQDQLKLLRKLEEAINFGQRRLLHVVQKDTKGAIDSVSTQRLTALFHTYEAHVYDGKKLSGQAALAVTSELTGILGSLGRVTSMGQCLGGSLFSLRLDGVAAAAQYKGFPLEMLAKQAGDKFHFENCPFCMDKMKVFDLPGKIVCSGCGNVKICGMEHEHSPKHHINNEMPHKRPIMKKPKPTHSIEEQRVNLSPIGATEFFASFLH